MYLTNNAILAISRNQNFPETKNFGIRNITLKTVGSDTVADIDLFVKDTPTYKIFNNSSTKYLKIKIFEISNDVMLNDIQQNCKIIDDINYYIISNDCSSVDISADNYKKYEQNIDTGINLHYNFSLVFKEENKKYLKLGIIFYFDLLPYISEKKVSPKHINKSILLSNTKIENILKNDGSIENPDITKKIIKTKKIFSDINSLNNFFDIVNSLSKKTKILNEKSINLENTDSFFSNIYFSRDRIGNLNLLFNLDYEKLINKYSSFNKYNGFFRNGNFKEISKINSLKIIKRELYVNQKINKKPLIKDNKIYKVIDTKGKDIGDSSIIEENSDDLGSIREINGLFDKYLTFEVIDKEIYKSKYKSYYQYGIEINFEDNFFDYIDDLKNIIIYDSKIFDLYLAETTKSYFDKTINIFTQEFNDIFNTFYKNNIIESVSRFISTLKTLSIIKQNNISYEEELKNSFLGILNPQSANPDNIIHCKSIFTKTVDFIEKILKDKSSSKHNIEYWFENDYIDSSVDFTVGYSFFKRNNSGILRISNLDLEQRISDQIFEFTNDNNIPAEDLEYKYSFLSPYFIESKNIILGPLQNLLNINDQAFIDINSDIKSSIVLKNTFNIKKAEPSNLIKTSQEMDIVLKSEELLNNFSCVTTNLFKEKNDQELKGIFSTDNEKSIKNNIDPTFLYIGILKHLFKSEEQKNIDDNFNEIIPFQIKALKQNKDKYYTQKIVTATSSDDPDNLNISTSNQIKYLPSKKKNYLTSLGSMSRYLLLYNSIHRIQILNNIQNDIKNTSWQTLTKSIYDNLQENKIYLCKLTLYTNSDIKNFHEIELPIFDNYFILEKNVNQQEITQKLQEYLNIYDKYVSQTIETAYYDSENGRLITTEDGISPYFEEDLSDKTLVKEFVKTIAYGDRYRNSIFNPARLRQELIKRAGSIEAVESKYIKVQAAPIKNNNLLTNIEFLSYISDLEVSKIYNTLSNLDRINTNFKNLQYTLTRYQIINELLRRFGFSWQNSVKQILFNEQQRLKQEEEERIKRQQEKEKKEFDRQQRLKQEEEERIKRKISDRRKHLKARDKKVYSRSPSEKLDIEEYINFIILKNSGDRVYYPPYGSDIISYNEKDVEKILIARFGNWKTNFFSLKYFGTTLGNFIKTKFEHYEDLISFRKQYFDTELPRRNQEILANSVAQAKKMEEARRKQEEQRKLKEQWETAKRYAIKSNDGINSGRPVSSIADRSDRFNF